MTLIGARIGNIRVEEPLGAGGMGEVYRGFDVRLGRAVALKTIRGGERLDAEMRTRFLREARLLTRLRHPAICEVYDLVEWHGADVLIFELVDGETLRHRLKSGPMPIVEALEAGAGIARGLAAAHGERIVHRDIKPENVMLEASGGVKILDFGVSRALGDADGIESSEAPTEILSATLLSQSLTSPVAVNPQVAGQGAEKPAPGSRPPSLTEEGSLLGTLAYMSPEQARGLEVEESSDVYALGLLLQEMISGESAHETDLPLVGLLMHVQAGKRNELKCGDPGVEELIAELLEVEPEKRPTAAATAEALQGLIERPQRRRQKLRVLALSLALLLAATLALWQLGVLDSKVRQESSSRRALVEIVSSLAEEAAPERARGSQTVSREDLDRHVSLIDRELADDPPLRAELLAKLGSVYSRLGEYDEAENQLTRALDLLGDSGAGGPIRWRALRDLANVLSEQKRYQEAEPLFAEVLSGLEKDGVESQPGSSRELAGTLNDLGALHQKTGRLDSARELYQRALATYRGAEGEPTVDPLELAATLNNLAVLEQILGDYRSSVELYDESLAIFQTHAGEDHPDVAVTLTNIGIVRRKLGDFRQAEERLGAALRVVDQVFDGEDPRLTPVLYSYARLKMMTGELEVAEQMLFRSWGILKATWGDEDRDALRTEVALAEIWRRRGELVRASETLEGAASQLEAIFENPNRYLVEAEHARANLARDRGLHAEAEKRYLSTLDLAVAAFGDGHPDVEPIRSELRQLQGDG